MSEVYAPVMRAVVAAALALATATVVLVAVNTERSAEYPATPAFVINL